MNTILKKGNGEASEQDHEEGDDGVSESDRSCLVVLNKGSGTIKELLEEEGILEKVENRLRANGWIPDIQLVEGSEIDATVKKGLEQKVSCVIAGGGDGTTSSIASLLMGTQTAMGILPFGTLNLAARDLETPLEPLTAVGALKPERIREIDVLEVGDRVCLCVSVMGIYTKLLRAGGEFHGRSWWMKFVKLVGGFLRAYATSAPMSIEMHTEDDTKRNIKTRMLFVVPGGYTDTWGLMPERESLEVGHCKVLAAKHNSLFGLSKLVLRFVSGRAQTDPDLEAFEAEEIEIKVKRKKHLWLAIDGELSRHKLPLKLKLRKKSLRVIDPESPPGLAGTFAEFWNDEK